MEDNSRSAALAAPAIEGPGTSVAAEIERLYPELRARALFLTQNHDTANDLVQQACERALRLSGKLRPGTNLAAWLKRVIRNLFIDEYRSSRRTWVPLNADDETPAVEDSAISPLDVLTLADVECALRTLRACDRAILELAWFGGQSYRALADRLGVPPKTIGTRLFRAKAKLRKHLSLVFERARAGVRCDR